MKRIMFLLLVVILALSFAVPSHAVERTTLDAAIQASQKDSFDPTDYGTLDIKEISRFPERYVQEKITFEGIVLQTFGNREDGYEIRLATNGYFNLNEVVYLVMHSDPGFGILLDDSLRVYARFVGMYTFTTVIGAKTTIPMFVVDSIELIESESVSQTDTKDVDDADCFTVITEYTWSRGFIHSVGLVVRNDTSSAKEITCHVTFQDEEGSPIGVQRTTESAIGPGCEALFVLNNDEAFDQYEYEITMEEETFYVSIMQNLEVEAITTNTKAILSITNTGDIDAELVSAHVIFLNGDTAVDYNSAYVEDIRPGKTEMVEVKTRSTFDSVQVYFTGHGWDEWDW